MTEPETLECVQLYESRLADVDSLLVFNSFRLTGQKSSGKQQLLLRVIQCRKQACVSDSFVDFFFLEQLVKTSSYSEMSVWLLTCETDAWCDLFVRETSQKNEIAAPQEVKKRVKEERK